MSLPSTHCPARGRGRQIQLLDKTEKQKKEESTLRRERNRISAAQFRVKRKRREEELHERFDSLSKKCKMQKKTISKLNEKINSLKSKIEFIKNEKSNQTEEDNDDDEDNDEDDEFNFLEFELLNNSLDESYIEPTIFGKEKDPFLSLPFNIDNL